MAHFGLTVAVMTSAALLVACGTGGHSGGVERYSGGTDSDWYEHRQDEVGCAGEAHRAGVAPGDAFDNYVSNCVNDRANERD
jgi:hypothetical protein